MSPRIDTTRLWAAIKEEPHAEALVDNRDQTEEFLTEDNEENEGKETTDCADFTDKADLAKDW